MLSRHRQVGAAQHNILASQWLSHTRGKTGWDPLGNQKNKIGFPVITLTTNHFQSQSRCTVVIFQQKRKVPEPLCYLEGKSQLCHYLWRTCVADL